MQRASESFSAEQRLLVEQSVRAAEAQTSCEIVPVVATASGRYDRPEDIIGLWLAVIAAALVWWEFPRPVHESGSWDGLPVSVGLVVMVLSTVLAFILGTVIGSRVGWLRRLFTPRRQMVEEVTARAREIFFDKRVHHTTGRTGLLLYISLFEHMAVVLADQEIMDACGQPLLDRLCEQLTAGLQQGHSTDALCQTIAAASQQLSSKLPRQTDDVNELQDSLVLID